MSKKKTNRRLEHIFVDLEPETSAPAKQTHKQVLKPLERLTPAAPPVQTQAHGDVKSKPVSIRSEEQFPLSSTPAVSSNSGAMSLAFRTNEKNWATLRVVDETESRTWASEEQMLVKQVADQLSLALENARLFQETQQHADELTAINQIISSASQTLELHKLLENVLEQTLGIIGFSAGLVTLINDNDQRLELVAHHNLPKPILDNIKSQGFKNSLCEYVYLTKQFQNFPNLRQGAPIPVDGLIANNLLAYLGMPLKLKDQTIGTLCIFNNTPKQLEPRLLDLVGSIGVQIGFAIENARLFEATRESEQAVARSEGELRALFTAMTDVIIILDKEGRYLRIAPTNPSLLVKPPDELLGQLVDDVLPKDAAHSIKIAIEKALESNKTVSLEYMLEMDQREHWFDAAVSKLTEDQVFLVARDITERKDNELLQAANTQIAEAALSAPDIADLLKIIHKNINTLMPARNFYIVFYDERTDLMTFPYYADAYDSSLPPRKPGRDLSSLVLRTGRPILVTPEVYNELEKAGEVKSTGLHGVDWLGVPLRSGNQRFGIMAVQTYDPKIRLTKNNLETLNLIASTAAIAIERKRAEETLKRRNDYLSAAAEIGRLVTSTLDLNSIFNRTVQLVSERFGYYHAAIFIVAETGFNISLAEATGEGSEEMKNKGHSQQIDGYSIIGRAIQLGAPIVVNNTALDGTHKLNPFLPFTRSEAVIPLRVGTRVIGVLDIQSPLTDAFREEDMSVLQILTDQVAVAIDNARSYELSQQAVKEMREVDHMKSMFLANMSHELRTPLNSIIGFSRVILKGIDGPVSDLQGQDLTAIYNSGQHLLGLINDILDLSKIEAGKMELAFDEISVSDLINGVMSTAMGLIKDKPVKLVKNVQDNLPAVRADAIRVRQVLLNLLSNAAKFTSEGSITVDATVSPNPTGHPEVLVRVTDTGPGIDPKDQSKLFQPFSQIDGSLTRKTGGSGLGLSISQQLIQMHGGRIGLQSAIGQGSTFYFTLPIYRNKEEKSSLQDGKVILAIDDDSQVIALYERYLQPQGYQVIPLTDPTRAVERVKQLKPYAITLDIMMPGHDGWAVLNDLKADVETRDTPVIICSIIEDQERGFSLGAADYLLKPILEDDLLNALDRLNRDGSIHEVLIIDDNPSDLRLMEKILGENNRYKTTLAEGGQKGWNAILLKPPHAVVLDLFMPEMDGFTILEKMRDDPKLRDIPVIVVSGVDLSAEQQQQLKEFGQRLLNKGSLNESDLLNTIERVLKRVEVKN